MILINCTEDCIHQSNGTCSMENVGTLSNTTNTGCEFYVERKHKSSTAKKDYS